MNRVSIEGFQNPHQNVDRLSWHLIELHVTDLLRAEKFWTSALGMIVTNRANNSVALGTAEKTILILHKGASRMVEPAYQGLYHVAVGVRNQFEFSRILARLIKLQIEVKPTDHLLAKSLYLKDPDGLEIEITFETPERFGRFVDHSNGFMMYDLENRPHSGREALDVTAELAYAKGADLDANISKDAYLAHLHFKVNELKSALDWFEAIGFSRHLELVNWGFADMGAGQANTHRLAMNTWHGLNNDPAPNDMARLLRYELVVHDDEVLSHAPLIKDGNVWRGADPTGVEVILRGSEH